jgi:very-short-patch-repair endonuclease
MAAVLACGLGAALSHTSAGALWGISTALRGLHVTVPPNSHRRAQGIFLHQRKLAPRELRYRDGIPLTSPSLTLVDLATTLNGRQLEAAINAADKLDLIDPERLHAEVAAMPRRPGLAALRELLDRHALQLTDSDLERRFLRLVRRAGLPAPLTQQSVSGFRVDFFWPAEKLVVETDGLRYHRTPLEQARDRKRDQAHAAAGLTPLRFTHHEIVHEPRRVEEMLALVLRRAA